MLKILSTGLGKILRTTLKDSLFTFQDEGFFGVGEEHQSAALNVIAVLFGTDGKKESPFKHLLRFKDEEQEDDTQDESGDLTVQFEMEMYNEKSDESSGSSDIPSSDHESLPRDPCSSDNLSELFESLTECTACSQLQQQTNDIGASQINSAFATETHVGCTHDSQRPRGDPLYRRRSSGRIATAGGTEENTPNIPKSTENQVPDDRPDSGDLNLEELFRLGSLPTTVQHQDQAECNDMLLENQSSIFTSSSSSSFNVHSNSNSNSFSLPSNNTSRLPSSQNTFSLHSNALTGSCLNSVKSDYSVFGTQTLPVVVVASGLESHTDKSDGKNDDAIPKATFHWTQDDSNCLEDAGEALLSPLVLELCEVEGEMEQTHKLSAFEFPHVQQGPMEEPSSTTLQGELQGEPKLLSSLCLSQLGVEKIAAPLVFPEVGDSPERCVSPPTLQLPRECIEQADGGESLISPLIQHLKVQQRLFRGSSQSSEDGEGPEASSSLHVGPRIDSAELRLNLDFILDNSDDEDDCTSSAVAASCDLDFSYQNEAPSIPEKLLEAELKLNLDFIDEEDHPGDLSLDDVFITEPPQLFTTTIVQQQATNAGSEAVDRIQLGQISNSSAITTNSVCDIVANCGSKNNNNGAVKSAVNYTVDQNNSLFYFLNGDFGIWSSVLESVAARSPHHFWPSQFTQVGERAASVSRLPLEGADLGRSWGSSSSGSLFLSSGNPWGTTWLPISPRREEDKDRTTTACRPTSRLWDVNLQKFASEFESPRERCSTIENIQHYLMNLG